MLSQSKKNELMELIGNAIADTMDNEGFVYLGKTSEGLAFQDTELNVMIFKGIAKKDNFDIDEALTDYQIKQKVSAEKKQKLAEKKKKAQEKKQKEKEKIEEIEEKKEKLIEGMEVEVQ